ncbi:MAG: MetQ/NlpA family ABC transporter substrate-binding protein [Coriobacteriales bacterium]|jgi:D-methionine transport system substrate-binding protein|nr:MetQ/NlpA family ABC transporter substrate-binding protein [Coriobacteriales bacterium]
MKARNTARITIKKALTLSLSALLALSLSLLLAACGGTDDTVTNESDTTGSSTELTVIKVAASPTPHAEILNNLKDDLAAQGYDLQVVEYTDYIIPNTATEDGEVLANYFQHQPYLTDFNAENGTNLVSVGAVHFEPLGIYPGKTASLADLPDGATIAVPNDTTNEARALQLLQAQGLITLPADADLTVTPKDIVENPKNLSFVEVEAAAVPVQLADVDLGVINGNYALGANLDPASVLASEDVNSQAAQTYANILVVKVGSESDPAVQALLTALTSAKTRDFISTTYSGVVVPVF